MKLCNALCFFAVCLTSISFADSKTSTVPFIAGQALYVTQVIPRAPATAATCKIYKQLINHSITVKIPSNLHSAAVYRVMLNGQSTTMSTDNGFGPPFYLYGQNVKLNNLTMREVFIEFKDNTYTTILGATDKSNPGLVMRAAPMSSATESQGDCRIVGGAK